MKSVVKLSLHLSFETNTLLETLSAEMRISKSEVLRKSISLIKITHDAKKEGNKIGKIDQEGKLIAEIIAI